MTFCQVRSKIVGHFVSVKVSVVKVSFCHRYFVLGPRPPANILSILTPLARRKTCANPNKLFKI